MCSEGRVNNPWTIVKLEFRQFEEQNFPKAKRRVWFVDKKYFDLTGTWISEQQKSGCDQEIKVSFKKDNKRWG